VHVWPWWVFTTLRGHHYVPSTRSHHWNRVRCAIGPGNTSLYEATRHYFAWYLLNVAELPDHVVAAQLRHPDGGTLVRELYGHPDAAMARERIRAEFRNTTPVVALPTTRQERGAASSTPPTGERIAVERSTASGCRENALDATP
jgi:hypothetical protein